jgi:hypothetical protein
MAAESLGTSGLTILVVARKKDAEFGRNKVPLF